MEHQCGLWKKNLCEEKNSYSSLHMSVCLKRKSCIEERENIVLFDMFLDLFVKVRNYSPDVESFRLCSALNPDCSICMN